MRNKLTGFTLIELMITITILSILLFLGTSLTSAWINQAKIYRVINTTNSALLQARALALKNQNNQSISSNLAVTAVCNVDSTLQIYQVPFNGTSPCSTSNTVFKHFTLANNVVLYAGETPAVQFNCVAFNAAGIMIPTTNNCTVLSTYTVVVNHESQVFSID